MELAEHKSHENDQYTIEAERSRSPNCMRDDAMKY